MLCSIVAGFSPLLPPHRIRLDVSGRNPGLLDARQGLRMQKVTRQVGTTQLHMVYNIVNIHTFG